MADGIGAAVQRRGPARQWGGLGQAQALVLNGGRGAGATARREVLASGDLVPAPVREDVLLLVTELVTNAVLHAEVDRDESLRLELWRGPRSVRVEVIDPGTRFTRVRPRSRRDESGGWGLFLVERIADRWGVAGTSSGTCVWFEIGFEE